VGVVANRWVRLAGALSAPGAAICAPHARVGSGAVHPVQRRRRRRRWLAIARRNSLPTRIPLARAGDGVDEMPVPPLDDRALEALLSGAPSAQSGFDWLVPFVEDLAEASSRPVPVVRPALVMLLAEGFSTEKGELPATAASNVTGPAPQASGLPKWRKKKMLVSELLAGLTTKLAGLGMAAKAGLGLTLAAVSTTAAGAAGVLPAPVQHAVAQVVNTNTPLNLPDPSTVTGAITAVTGQDVTDPTNSTTSTTIAPTGTTIPTTRTILGTTSTTVASGGPSSQAANHGSCVSAVAGDKSATVDGNHGKAVSAVAKSDCGKTTGGETPSSTTPTTVGSTTSTTVSGATGATSSGSSGKGKGNSNGKANSSRND